MVTLELGLAFLKTRKETTILGHLKKVSDKSITLQEAFYMALLAGFFRNGIIKVIRIQIHLVQLYLDDDRRMMDNKHSSRST